MIRFASAVCLLVLVVGSALSASGQGKGKPDAKPDKDYLVYVLSESADRIALVRFGPNGARIDHELQTGDMPVDIDGPHGIVVSPDKQFYYVSLGHGRPYGSVWKYATSDDRVLGRTTLGFFPATMDLSRDGKTWRQFLLAHVGPTIHRRSEGFRSVQQIERGC